MQKCWRSQRQNTTLTERCPGQRSFSQNSELANTVPFDYEQEGQTGLSNGQLKTLVAVYCKQCSM